jgi:hypothetical protein
VLDERIEAIKALWTTEPAEYHGKYVDFDPSYLRPKPVQKPHPPIYIGGDSDATVKRVIRHEAGWISNPLPVDHLSKRIGQIPEGAGHDVPLAQFGTPTDPDYWRAVEDLGFGQVALLLPTKPLDDSLRLLDEPLEFSSRGSKSTWPPRRDRRSWVACPRRRGPAESLKVPVPLRQTMRDEGSAG